ncbi:LmeA family phospholipid-binding protein [Actinomyces sp. 565]|uniref:LmeA family phospholipid-binding protein n=1 Tax=Actinomyces sp. 565 TaxID=2057794 RepID=UPI0013A6F3F4|nr:LmeA family phospholipid-binding protein [Actinomyces sp. 565]NDR53364.1 DUF2993 domain-containing protein [Actinomyces sp. 565]
MTANAATPDLASTAGPDDAQGAAATAAGRQEGARSELRRHGRQRWRRRGLAALLVLVCVAAGGLVGAERYARGQVEQTVRAALPGLAADASITTDGIVLPQLLRHELKTLSLRSESLVIETGSGGDDASADPTDAPTDAGGTGDDPAGAGLAAVASLEFTNVTANLTEVGTRDPYRAGEVYASAAIGFDELERLVAAAAPDVPELTITPDVYGSTTEPGRVTALATVLGVDASLTFEPVVTDAGGLKFSVVSLNVFGVDIDVDDPAGGDDTDGAGGISALSLGTALEYFGLDKPEIEIGPEVLPEGLTLSQAYVARDGVRLTLSGSDVSLASW